MQGLGLVTLDFAKSKVVCFNFSDAFGQVPALVFQLSNAGFVEFAFELSLERSNIVFVLGNLLQGSLFVACRYSVSCK